MAHYSHPAELATDAAVHAVKRIISTGAVVRAQAPLIAHVNDDENLWAQLWTKQVRLGVIPYYMFVERDTGAKQYFEVPVARAFDIFTRAFQQVSGLARTVRGPVMSATPGKVLIDGIATIGDEPAFVLKMLQARDPGRGNGVFFARFDERATWFDELRPIADEDSVWFPHLADRSPHRSSWNVTHELTADNGPHDPWAGVEWPAPVR
jgi:hypothetical protein